MLAKKILIVEDETILREAYSIVLSSHGYIVSTAANGLLAINHISADLPDLILLDMLMPVMGGEQFLDESDILTKHKSVRIIVYSNISDREKIEKLLLRGVHEHIVKSSMAPNQLAEYVKNALQT
jgi:two-component system response regulator